MSEWLMEAKGITKVYGTVVKTRALKGIDLGFHAGEFASIIGYSGSGKTTLLNILGALDKPTEGSLWFQGEEVSRMGEKRLAAFRNRNIGFVFQFHHLLPEFTALENVLIPTWIQAGNGTRRQTDRAKELLELVGLKEQINNKSTDLSGGQQQRVAIARALINEPALILADEPTGNLDSETTEQVYSLMRDINDRLGTAFLVVTHNDHIAAKSDRIITMKDGLVVRDETTTGRPSEEVWQTVAPGYCRHCYKDAEEVNNQLL
ncbi:ABC transporter ATP-binding protein [Anoxynatronum sibiricum]|uniref:ABC transporter ATP-binding protein n=1 Tax=Anoxynatronum sibiricum TaxID=210623 RepID=A0ABU9VSQ1_9CLOT